MHVLLVDDDVRGRQMLARVLHRAGLTIVGQAGDGRAALRALKTIRPDLVLTDCEMPGMDGIGLTRTLRAQGDQTPVVMLTGQADPAVAAEAAEAGVTAYLLKPLDLPTLLEALQAAAGCPAVA
jgi:CheY-like chemotaxis protein